MLRSLVGSEMCIRDRLMQRAENLLGEAEQRRVLELQDVELRTLKQRLGLADKHNIQNLRALHCKPHGESRESETAWLHPHYCGARAMTVFDPQMNRGHAFPVEHRLKPTSSQHMYASMRDTRDLMNREIPLMTNRMIEHRRASDDFLRQADQNDAKPAVAQEQAGAPPAGPGWFRGWPQFGPDRAWFGRG
eukprot:TRINITY_DN14511_c0_g1_i4.p1 TRINITY_DN14511_c0_g1~~TRINITY_DN14511_c0_g1_i4.p1  ORF type:complete len:191 (-),score=23.11 TRINITY_DN14511_c0_g1_i4:165-737(-)